MKKLEVTIYMGFQDQFEILLEEEGVEEYLISPKVLGRLKGADPKMNTHVWPGYLMTYHFCAEEKKYARLKERIMEIKEEWTKEGFMTTVTNVQERIGCKL